MKASTLNGLLSYNAVPGRTVFVLANGKVATATGNLEYLFAPRAQPKDPKEPKEERGCVFFPYWKDFMERLQGAFCDIPADAI